MDLAKQKIMREFATSFAWSFTLASFVVLSIVPAMAQAVSAPSGGVDFSPLANNVITAVTAILGVAVAVLSKFAVSWISSKTSINDAALEQLMANRVDDILHRAIDYANAWAKTQVADPNSPLKHVQIDNFFLRQAVDYAVRAMPDLIAYFKLTDARIADMIRSRLNVSIEIPKADSGVMMTTQAAQGLYSERSVKDLVNDINAYVRDGGSIQTSPAG